MSVGAEGEKKTFAGRIGGVIAFVAIVAVAKVGGAYLGREGVHQAQNAMQSQEDFERQIDEMADRPDGVVFKALQTDFPTEYAGIRSRLAQEAKSGKAGDEMRIEAFRLSRSFIVGQAKNVASAGDEELAALASKTYAAIEALAQADTVACAQFAVTGLDESTRLPAATVFAMGEIAAAGIHAARSGIDRPVDRPAELSDADAEAMVEGLQRAGLSEELIQAVGTGLEKRPVEDQCRAGVGLYKAIARMPTPQSARWMAYLTRNTGA